jgi:hypothetical protein
MLKDRRLHDFGASIRTFLRIVISSPAQDDEDRFLDLLDIR